MISEKQLEAYYKLKEKELIIKQQLLEMRNNIVKELEDKSLYEGEKYTAEIRFSHEVTKEFIDFLKRTGNERLIKETSTCDAFKEMTEKFNLTEDEKKRFCVEKASPSLIVKKNKKVRKRK